MAARGRGRKKSSKNSGSFVGAVALFILPLVMGVALGYAWRSYYPLALPYESKLVSDKASADTDKSHLKEVARAAERRAEAAESERDRLRKRLAELEEDQQRTEMELGDLQIKSVLKGEGQ